MPQSSFKILKNLRSNFKPKNNVILQVRFSYYYEFKVKHAFHNQSFFQPSFNHLYALPRVF